MLLFQSVRELLINSLKHAGTDEATVTMEQHDGNLFITVSDKGNGFDLAAGPPSGESSKFGLFSIRERMRALGGSFEIQSAPGQGTNATLMLPTARSVEDREPTTRDASVVSPISQTSDASRDTLHDDRPIIRVLLVDDHAMVRQGLRSVLDAYDDMGWWGGAGRCGGREAGWELRPRVVVMDINRPKMNGIEATARIKTQWPETIVVGISVNTGDANGQAMKESGAARLITKEAAVDELHAVIRRETTETVHSEISEKTI